MSDIDKIRKAYDLISTGLLYLDATVASQEAGHSPLTLEAIQVANKAVMPLQTLLDRLRSDCAPSPRPIKG